jgi:hypothetical protein
MSDSLLQRYNDSLEPQPCPTCSSPSTLDFLKRWRCPNCFTIWDKYFISKGEPFDDEPDMCTDFDEFAKRQ